MLLGNDEFCLRLPFTTARAKNGSISANLHSWSLKEPELPVEQLIVGRVYFTRNHEVISEIKKLQPVCENYKIKPMFSKLIEAISDPCEVESSIFEEICKNVYVVDLEKLNLFNLVTPENTVSEFFQYQAKNEHNIFATRTALKFLSPESVDFNKDLVESNKKTQILNIYRKTDQLKELLQFQETCSKPFSVVSSDSISKDELEELLRDYDEANYNRISEDARKIIELPYKEKPKKIICKPFDDID